MSNLDTQLKTFLQVAQPGSFRRAARPLIQQGLLRQVEEAPVFERPALIIYPSSPSHPDVQAIALQGLREVAPNDLLS